MPLSLDAVFSALGIDPLAGGVQIVPARHLKPPAPFAPLQGFSTTKPLLVCNLGDAQSLVRVQAALLPLYSAGQSVVLVYGSQAQPGRLGSLDQADAQPELCAFVPALPLLEDVRSADTLQEVTARLRAPGGCPWDREQTHESLKPYLLEETYEVLETLDSGSRADLCEELGDLLMQVMIHAQIAAEEGEFSLGDVLAGISSKLMRRHPHVFGNVQVSGSQEVLRNWQSIKQGEKQGSDREPPPSLLGSVPVQLPALAYAQAILERSARAGFRQPAPDAFAQAAEGIDAARRAATPVEKLAAYGDLLFALVQVGRSLDVEAEEALRMANRRYRDRFTAVETLCRQGGLDVHQLDDAQRQALWHEAENNGE
jgi:tetrapyrrole methylase family protein / MazG family protein